MPTYRISDLDIREILEPMNSVMAGVEAGTEWGKDGDDAGKDKRPVFSFQRPPEDSWKALP
jgi:hypothetical protein